MKKKLYTYADRHFRTSCHNFRRLFLNEKHCTVVWHEFGEGAYTHFSNCSTVWLFHPPSTSIFFMSYPTRTDSQRQKRIHKAFPEWLCLYKSVVGALRERYYSWMKEPEVMSQWVWMTITDVCQITCMRLCERQTCCEMKVVPSRGRYSNGPVKWWTRQIDFK